MLATKATAQTFARKATAQRRPRHLPQPRRPALPPDAPARPSPPQPDPLRSPRTMTQTTRAKLRESQAVQDADALIESARTLRRK